jgi:uncharacterized protein YjbI with pentapeptide repeats
MELFEPPKYIEKLIAAINDGAKSAQLGALALTAIGVFLLATTFATTDEDLLLGHTVTISQLGGASVPVALAFGLAPTVFVAVHFYTLIRFDMLRGNLRHFKAELEASVPLAVDRERCRQLLANVEFISAQVMPRGSTTGSWLFGATVVVLLAVIPALVLVLVHIGSLRLQSEVINTVHHVALAADLWLLIWYFSHRDGGRSSGFWRAPWRRKLALCWLPLLVVAMDLAWLNVPAADSDTLRPASDGLRPDLTRYRWPGLHKVHLPPALMAILNLPRQPLDLWWCAHDDYFGWGCRFLTVKNRTLAGRIWDSKAFVELRGGAPLDEPHRAAFENVSLYERVLRFANLSGSELLGADLSGSDLRNARLTGANLKAAKLRSSNLRGAQLNGVQLQDADLEGALLEGAELAPGIAAVVLEHAKLLIECGSGGTAPGDVEWQNFRDDVEFGEVELKQYYDVPNLERANLRFTSLSGVDLTGVQLKDADLRSSILQGANLHLAHLQGAKLQNARAQGADLSGAWLNRASLRKAQLQAADLSGAKLEGADLSEAQLQGAILNCAQLQSANLSRAHLDGVELHKAALHAMRVDSTTEIGLANFRDADFSKPASSSTPAEVSSLDSEAKQENDPGAPILPRMATSAGPLQVSDPNAQIWGQQDPTNLVTDPEKIRLARVKLLADEVAPTAPAAAEQIASRVLKLRDAAPTHPFIKLLGCRLQARAKSGRIELSPDTVQALAKATGACGGLTQGPSPDAGSAARLARRGIPNGCQLASPATIRLRRIASVSQ